MSDPLDTLATCLNRALFVALASEFQGYCRDLHDNAVFVMTDGFEPSSDLRLPILRNALVRGRKLDTGNAQPASLGSDFNAIVVCLMSQSRVPATKDSIRSRATYAR